MMNIKITQNTNDTDRAELHRFYLRQTNDYKISVHAKGTDSLIEAMFTFF